MKNYLKFAFIGFSACLLSSCQEKATVDEPIVKLQSTDKTIELTSLMNNDEFLSACIEVKNQIGSSSRAIQMSQSEAKKTLQPFV